MTDEKHRQPDIAVFVYGTLKDATLRQKVLGRPVPGTDDKLPRYFKEETEIFKSQYGNIVPSTPTEHVDGVLFYVTEEELKKLDDWEHYEYNPEPVTLKSGVKAFAYMEKKHHQRFIQEDEKR